MRTLNTTRSCFHSWREASNLSHNNFLCILIFTRKYFSDFDFYLRLRKSERGKQWQASHKMTTRGENVVGDSVNAHLPCTFCYQKKNLILFYWWRVDLQISSTNLFLWAEVKSVKAPPAVRVGPPVYVSFEGKLLCTVAGHVRTWRSGSYLPKKCNKTNGYGNRYVAIWQKDCRIDRSSKFGTSRIQINTKYSLKKKKIN